MALRSLSRSLAKFPDALATQTMDNPLAPVGDTELVRADRPVEVMPPAVLEPKTGSSLDTLYGVDDESYLTDDQRKMVRMIQGRFDASSNRRDRELARYGAPRLSSFVNDEALARAIAQAGALNYREPEEPADPFRNVRGIPQNREGRPSIVNNPAAPEDDGPTSAQTGAQWQRILSGLTSLVPLLFGKDAYGNFLNKGLIQWGKEQLFGSGAPSISDAQFEQLVRSGGMNPFTGLPMGPMTPGTDLVTQPDIYGPGSGWGEDVIQNAQPDWSGWWDEGYWYPDLNGADFLPDDPFGIGGW